MYLRCLAMLLVALLWVAGCAPPATPIRAAPTKRLQTTLRPTIAQPTATERPQLAATKPAPTRRPTRTPTAIPTEVTSQLSSELFFSPGLGGVGGCASEPVPDTATSQPVISTYPTGGTRSWGLCLFGFPLGGAVTLKLFGPDGQVYGGKTDTVEEQALSGVTALFVPVQFPPPASGVWRLTAELPDGSSTTLDFDIGQSSDQTTHLPWTMTISRSAPNLLNVQDTHAGFCARLDVTDQALMFGANLKPQTEFPIGVYARPAPQDDWERDHPDQFWRGTYSLSASTRITTNERGEFTTTLNKLPAGHYLISLAIDPQAASYNEIGPFDCVIVR